jgi:MFS family permease
MPLTRFGRNFFIAFCAQFWFTIAATLWAQYSRWINFLGGDESAVGWIMGGGTALALLIRPWLAETISRFGAKRTWLFGMLLLAVTAVGNLFLGGLGAPLFLLQTASTVATAVIYAAGLTYVAEIAPPKDRTEMIGAFGVAGFAGVLIGPSLTDFVLNGHDRSRENFVWMFVGATAVLAVAILLVANLRQPPRLTRTSPFGVDHFFRDLRRYWPGAVVWVNFVFGVCMIVPFRFLSRFVDAAHLESFGLGNFFVVYAGVGIVVRLSMRDWPERWGLATTVFCAMIGYGIGLATFPWADSGHAWRLMIPAFICGLCHAVWFHSLIALTIAPFPADKRGDGAVLALMMQDLGHVVSMPILGQLADVHFRYLFFAASATCFVFAFYFGWSKLHARRRRLIEAQEHAAFESPVAVESMPVPS